MSTSIPQDSVTCPDCDGKASAFTFVNTGPDCSKHYSGIMRCQRCLGRGWITPEEAEAIKAGKVLRDKRIQAGISLMQAAKERGITLCEMNDIERGRKPNVLSR